MTFEAKINLICFHLSEPTLTTWGHLLHTNYGSNGQLLFLCVLLTHVVYFVKVLMASCSVVSYCTIVILTVAYIPKLRIPMPRTPIVKVMTKSILLLNSVHESHTAPPTINEGAYWLLPFSPGSHWRR